MVDGAPFFPVMLLDQCDAPNRGKDIGINLVLDDNCGAVTPKEQLSALDGHQLGALPIAARPAAGSRLVGWTYPDEPENNGWTAARLANEFHYARGNADGRIGFVTTTGGFFHWRSHKPRIAASAIGDIGRLADVAGFDLYPLNHCHRTLVSVYDAQRRFISLVGAMPTFQWIETGPIRPDYCGGFTMTPDQLTAEAWLAVAGGARGIGFFTHTWNPAHSSFDVSPPVEKAIARFADLASLVEPGLVGRTVPSSTDAPAIKVVAREAAGKIYVFAVNSGTSPTGVKISVPMLRNENLDVVGENRSLTVSGGRFDDHFGRLAVHLYVQ